jgi:hypothetical protein
MPVVGIENPALDLRSKHGLPRLTLGSDSWSSVVEDLVKAAEAIVFFVDRITPGVEQELASIRRWNREAATVVVKPASTVADQMSEFRSIVREGSTWTVRDDHQTRGGPRLAKLAGRSAASE